MDDSDTRRCYTYFLTKLVADKSGLLEVIDYVEKINNILNVIIGASFGVFIGHGIYVYWDYKIHPDLYAMQSAPWYARTRYNKVYYSLDADGGIE